MCKKRPVILGTDWWTDCDDCVALRLLCRESKAGHIDLKGVSIDACMPFSAPSLDLFVKNEGFEHMPVAVDLEAVDFEGDPSGSYQEAICGRFSAFCRTNEMYENPVRLYRRILAESTEKTDIIEIGFMQVLADLLKSEPDDLSPLTGSELVEQRVGCLWAMAGKWDEEGGKEHNFCNNKRSVDGGRYVCAHWKTPIVFLGFEVGLPVITGGQSVLTDEHDLLRIAMEAHGSRNGRNSWDPMLALLACIGDIGQAGYRSVCGRARVDENGKNYFDVQENGLHQYVVKEKDDSYYRDAIHATIK